MVDPYNHTHPYIDNTPTVYLTNQMHEQLLALLY